MMSLFLLFDIPVEEKESAMRIIKKAGLAAVALS